MTMIGMPNIPNFAGLATSAADAAISLGGAALLNAVFGNVWGIVNQYGVPILLSDNVIGLNYTNQSQISKAPVEKGSFTSYNKVASPRKATVQLSKGKGGALARGAWLAQLETYANSTLNFYIISPEFVYKSMNIVGLSYSREASSGMQLIVANIELEEVKTAKVDYSYQEVANPADAASEDGGAVQPTDQSKNVSVLAKVFG